MSKVTILGAGMAGFGAAHRLAKAGCSSVLIDKNPYHGGHAASFSYDGGWIFDDGPHISFTKVERMQELFASNVDGEFEKLQAEVNNYWKGRWIKHPVCCNMHGLPRELIDAVIREIGELEEEDLSGIGNYAEWLIASYGRTYAETFPMVYGLKFHTTTADNMTTDWCGNRLYRPTLEEVKRGAASTRTDDVHYIDHFRYPTNGGFGSYSRRFSQESDLRLGHKVVRLERRNRRLLFEDGESTSFDKLISSLPLPVLIALVDDAPEDVRQAARRLACTSCVVVNLGVNRTDLSPAHWSYFYDDDVTFARLSFPHMFSPNVTPPGCGSIQAEIYFSEKYRPLRKAPEEFIPVVVEDLKKCGLLSDEDEILFSNAMLLPWAQVIYDHDRAAAVEVVHAFLEEIGIATCGRFGEWGYHWTDESFMSGERAAERVLEERDMAGAR